MILIRFSLCFCLLILINNTTYALHADRQGSVIAVTDQATGTLAARYKYDAFGAQEQTVSLITQPYGFTGREFDPESGLYYYRARTYDPTVGVRFWRGMEQPGSSSGS